MAAHQTAAIATASVSGVAYIASKLGMFAHKVISNKDTHKNEFKRDDLPSYDSSRDDSQNYENPNSPMFS